MFGASSRTPQAADWAGGVVAVAVGTAIALWDAQPGHGFDPRTIQGHTARVNCVRLVPPDAPGRAPPVLVSGSVDQRVGVWRWDDGAQTFVHAQWLVGHTAAVETLAVAETAGPGWITVMSASADGTVRAWDGEAGALACTQTIPLGTKYALALALHPLLDTGRAQSHGTDWLLATGGVDACVHLHVRRGGPGVLFTEVAVLRGHDDWVRGLAFAQLNDGEIVLASASQDRYIRLWQVRPSAASAMARASEPDATVDELLRSLEQSGLAMKPRAQYFAVPDEPDAVFSVVLDALLIGHDDWVYSVAFVPRAPGQRCHAPRLLSASMDKTLMVWAPHDESGVWFNEVRVGDFGGQNVFGFYGGLFGPDGAAILSHGFNGALHLWRRQGDASGAEQWQPCCTPSGHYGPVNDVAWDRLGRYLMSVSDDQTARLFAPVTRGSWHEIARPQVHGYDLQCLTMCGVHEYLSGGDEKVLRLFDAPQSFIESFAALTGAALTPDDRAVMARAGAAQSAATPALGLSNKAVPAAAAVAADDDDGGSGELDLTHSLISAPVPSSLSLSSPPVEEQLLQSTLWAETDKLYGHPYEIYAVACDRRGSTAVSACKATQASHALIRAWTLQRDAASGATTARADGTLPLAHTLTITQMRFSHDDRLLLSVSRDRSFALFRRHGDTAFQLVHRNDKAHARIIWACAFTLDDAYFLTCSRDGAVKVWACGPEPSEASLRAPVCTLQLDGSVTALDVSEQRLSDGAYVAVVGLESGALLVLEGRDATWRVQDRLVAPLCHTAAVQRVAWRPGSAAWEFASAGADHQVRINVARK